MIKQTAVEWLKQELWEQFKFSFSNNIFEQAKEMEKSQAPSWAKDCNCPHETGVVFCCDECGLPFENKTITDQDIDQEAKNHCSKYEITGRIMEGGFIEGAKWYKQQINKQTKLITESSDATGDEFEED
jgi:hypothetical protein